MGKHREHLNNGVRPPCLWSSPRHDAQGYIVKLGAPVSIYHAVKAALVMSWSVGIRIGKSGIPESLLRVNAQVLLAYCSKRSLLH